MDDLLIIAAELLNEVKVYDQSVLNPVNTIQMCILEYGLKRSPQNKAFVAWLMKIYSKLGMTHLVT